MCISLTSDRDYGLEDQAKYVSGMFFFSSASFQSIWFSPKDIQNISSKLDKM